MADRDLRIRMLLEAADRVSRPLRDIAGGSTRASAALRGTRDQLRAIQRAQADIAEFRQLKTGTRAAEQAMLAAKTRAAELGRQLAATENPTRAMTREFAKARASANQLEAAHQVEVRRLGELREKLRAAGIATTDLARHERDLRDRAAATSTALADQTRRVEALADRQRRFAAARERFGQGQALGSNMAIAGTASIGSGIAVARPLTGAIGAAQRYQSVMTDIAQKGDLTRKQATLLGRELLVAARNANQLPEDMQRGVDTLSGLGATVPDGAKMMPSIGRAATAYKAEVDDMAAATYAVKDGLKVAVADTGRVIDIMAQSGKRGAFELRDMAAAFPSLTGAYQGLGQKGLPAVADLAAGLQVMRKNTKDSATAGTNMENVLRKIASPATNRAFAKMGVDLPKALKKAYREGKTPLEAIAQLTKTTLKGDMGKLGYLFEDAQVQEGLRAVIQNFEEYKRIRAEAFAANGTTDRDFAERMQDSAEKTKALQVRTQVLAVSLGERLLPITNKVLEKASALAERMSNWSQRHPTLTKVILYTAAGLATFLIAAGGLTIALAALTGPFHLVSAAARLMGTTGTSAMLTFGRALLSPLRMIPLLGRAVFGMFGIIGRGAMLLMANPVVAIIIGIAVAIGVAVYLIHKNWGTIGPMFARVWAWVGRTTSAAVDWFARLPSRFADFGRNLIGGLINGVTGMLGKLKSTIVNAAASAANWFKAKLGIRSPSRVFAGFGGFMMEGLDRGIAGGADGPLRQVDGVSRRLTAALAAKATMPLVANVEIADITTPPVRRIDGISRRLTAALAAGAAMPMVATVAAATPATNEGRGVAANGAANPNSGSRAARGGDRYEVHFHAVPGMKEAELFDQFKRWFEDEQRRKDAAARSSFADNRDDWG